MDWSDVIVVCEGVAQAHGGTARSCEGMVELQPPAAGDAVRVHDAGHDAVRVEGGWQIRRYLDLGDGQHLREILGALLTGHATENFAVQDDDQLVPVGYQINYAGGRLASGPPNSGPLNNPSQRTVQRWGTDEP